MNSIMKNLTPEEIQEARNDIVKLMSSENPPANWANFLADVLETNQDKFGANLLRIMGEPVTDESFDRLMKAAEDFCVVQYSSEDCEKEG